MGKGGKGGGQHSSSMTILIALLAFAVLLFWLPLTFEIFYHKDRENDLLICSLRLTAVWQLYRLEIPSVYSNFSILGNKMFALETEMPNSLGNTEEHKVEISKPLKLLSDVWPTLQIIYTQFKKIYAKINKVNRDFFRTISCEELTWHTAIGLPDAALTAISTGFLWNLKNLVFNNLHNNVRVAFNKPSFEVKPVFNSKCFDVNFKCIFAVRLGNIIFAGLKLLVLILGLITCKGGNHNERSSDRSANENGNGKH